MIEQTQRRVPMPIIAASMILIVAAAYSASRMLLVPSGTSIAIGLIGVLLPLVLAYGLWRGDGRARFWTTVLSTASIVYDVAVATYADPSGLAQILAASVIIGLLLVPATSRRWFHDLPADE